MSKLILSEQAESFIYDSIDAIINSTEPTRTKLRKFATLLDMNPHNSWVELHPLINGYAYVPIGRIESLLRLFFGTSYRVRVLAQQQLFNAVQVTVRLYYTCPITGQKHYQDGVGAKELQTAKGTGVLKMDFSNVNKSAVEMAVGIAKSTAIKDAADLIGKIFGRDVNRQKTLSTVDTHILNNGWQSYKYETVENIELVAKVKKILSGVQSISQLAAVWKDTIRPLISKAGAHENNFANFGQAARERILKKLEEESVKELPVSNDNIDIGELTEKELRNIAIQNIDNE